MRFASEKAAVIALVLVLTLPFLQKPFHVDDIFYVRVAETILKTPLDPFSSGGALMDEDYRAFAKAGLAPTLFEGLNHPPLLPYFLAGIAALSGGLRELPLHLGYVAFTLAAGLFTLRLARRFSPFPPWSTLFVVASPAFALPAQGLMTDMPSLALTLGAIVLFVEGADSNRKATLFGAGALLGFALLVRYTALSVGLVWVAYVVLLRRSPRHLLPALAGAAIVFAPWAIQNLVVHGQLHILAGLVQAARVNAGRPVSALAKTLCDVAALGGVSWPVTALLVALGRWRRRALGLASALAVAALASALARENPDLLMGYTGATLAAMIVALALGVFLIGEALRAACSGGRDGLFLGTWLAIACLAAFFVLPFGATRYMLPTLPALSFLLASGVAAEPPRPRRALAAAGLVLTVALSLALGAADLEFARAYESFARSTDWKPPSGRAFFLGDWGFRYYMEQAGARFLLSTDASPARGDVIVRAYTARLHDMSDQLRARAELLDVREPGGRLPLRLLNHEARAGFYSSGWGLLPYAVSREPFDRFEIYRLRD